MSAWSRGLDALAAGWADALWRASWQGGLALSAVWLLCRLVPALSPNAQCWLWRLATLKFLIALLGLPTLELAVLPPRSRRARPC